MRKLLLILSAMFILTAGIVSAGASLCNMELTKSSDKQMVAPGENVTFILHYKNTGNAVCTGGGVRIQDVLNENLVYGGSYNVILLNDIDKQSIHASWYTIPLYDTKTNTLTWNAHTVSPGEEGIITFNATFIEQEECGSFEIPNSFSAWSNQRGTQYSNIINVIGDNDCPPEVPEFKPLIILLTALGAVGIFFVVRRK